MMTRIIIIVFSLLAILSLKAGAYSEQLVIVVHKDTPIESLTKSEVIDIFMGKYTAYPNGQKALAVELTDQHTLKERFYRQLIGRSVASVNAYWARLKFAGRKRNAEVKDTQDEVIEYLRTTPLSIGYITVAKLDDNLKVVYQIDE